MNIDIGWTDLLFALFLVCVGFAIRRVIREGHGPIDMVLHCPACGHQHVDAPAPALDHVHDAEPWTNPPHRTHLCGLCGHRWRPADIPTYGVPFLRTRGKNDSPSVTSEWNAK